MPNRMPVRLPEDMSDVTPVCMPEGVSNRTPVRKRDRMPEKNMLHYICIYLPYFLLDWYAMVGLLEVLFLFDGLLTVTSITHYLASTTQPESIIIGRLIKHRDMHHLPL